MFRPMATALFAIHACCPSAHGQSPIASPTFDAASVKIVPFVPAYSRSMKGGPGTTDPQRITYSRVTLIQIVTQAYDVRPDQVTGPAWISDNSNMLDITATHAAGTSPEQFRGMLRNLLTERFHLALHHESKDFPAYELVLANGGPKFKASAPANSTEPPAAGFAMGRDGTVRMRGPGISGIYWNGAQRYGIRERTMAQFVALLGGMIKQSLGSDNRDSQGGR